MIAKNTGNFKIMIVTKWHEGKKGGPAIIDSTYSLLPGEAIDLKILGVTCESAETTLQFYADPHSYEKGYTPLVYSESEKSLKGGLLTDPLVIQDGGKRAREVLGIE